MMRYAEKPFLQYLDSFVLRAIGELTEQQERAIRLLSPAFVQADGTRPWFDIVAERMSFSEGYVSEIASVWEAIRQSALEQGLEISPIEFTRLFVDANFPT
ncbi:MAG: hypothetical protein QM681_09770 [Novosphingobium sp.]